MSIIETNQVTKIYGAGQAAVTAVDSVSLAVEQGEFVAVMGPSGCGKSTLLHLMGGLDRPTSGSVLIGGQNLAELNDDQLTGLRRKKMGFIFQFFNLIPVLTAVENAALPLTLDGARLGSAKAQAADWLIRTGLGDRLNNRPDQLSGGEQQRVAIARALIAEPDLVLADEPTGNLDTRAGNEIAEVLRQVSKEWGRTVVMVTHDPLIAAYSDRIVFLKDGKVSEQTRLDVRNRHNAEIVSDTMRAIG